MLDADEVFLTNSIQEIVPVLRLEDRQGNSHSPGGRSAAGPVTIRLMNGYRAAAEEGAAQ
jgi:4-amino-4-deoxychorismate lyase